jgi:glucose-1-phosphate thymidylyltransferase
MKAIIPVAGMGMRLRPHTYTQPKPLIPVAGKPILGFIVDRLRAAGFDEFVFVIGYLGEKIEAYVSQAYPDIKAHFVNQHTREGLGHAIWLTRKVVGPDEPIFVALGDTIFEADIEAVLAGEHSTLGVKKVDDPGLFGVAEIGENGLLTRVVEKPEIPKSNMALVGLYLIRESAALFDALGAHIEKGHKTQGEYHLTDAIQQLIRDGVPFTAFKVQNWYDCGKKDILLETNRTLLHKPGHASPPAERYENTIIVPPVAIAESAVIAHSIVGPNVTIGENTEVRHAMVQDSIVGNFTKLEHIALYDSVIGSDTAITGLRHSLNIGDNTEIDLS